MSILKNLKLYWQKGFIHILIGNGLFAVVAFGAQLLVAGFLEDKDLGYIKVFQSITQVMGIVCGMGLSTSVLILCADGRRSGEKKSLFYSGALLLIPISVVVWIIFFVLNNFGLWSKISEVTELLTYYSVVMVLAAFSAILVAYLQSQRVFKNLAKLLISTKSLSLVIMVCLTYLFGIHGFMIGLIIGMLLSLIINLFYVNKNTNLDFRNIFHFSNHTKYFKDHYTLAINGLGANLFSSLAISMDILMLNFLKPNELSLIGQYSFATIIILGLGILQGSIVQVGIPNFSKIIGNTEKIKFLYNRYSLIIFAGGVFLFIVFSYLLPVILNLLFNAKYTQGLAFLSGLLFVWFWRMVNAINVSLISGLGKTQILNFINFVYAFILFIGIYFSLTYYDIQFMIIVMIIATVFIWLLSLFFCKSIIKMN